MTRKQMTARVMKKCVKYLKPSDEERQNAINNLNDMGEEEFNKFYEDYFKPLEREMTCDADGCGGNGHTHFDPDGEWDTDYEQDCEKCKGTGRIIKLIVME